MEPGFIDLRVSSGSTKNPLKYMEFGSSNGSFVESRPSRYSFMKIFLKCMSDPNCLHYQVYGPAYANQAERDFAPNFSSDSGALASFLVTFFVESASQRLGW
uniref:Uncharacterized protein n=1 Tax=Coccidioides posadasii RMSCC 3488 TaxID=454284 RepID=A0A0J6FTK0_COCPO|nr:hypothetical protein CPAG_08738 [Coccidioides posadasii RMSCC 3488]